MEDAVGQAALYGGIGSLVGVLGATLAVLWPPTPLLESYVQHFAAGVVLAGAALELLPEATAAGSAGVILAGFAVGGLAMVGLDLVTDRLEQRGGPASTGLVAAIAVDVLVDGLIIGASFAAGGTTGALIAVALSIELFFLSVSTGASFLRDGVGRLAAAVRAGGVAVLLVVGAVAGALVFESAGEEVLAAALSFAAAVLIYVPTEELLTEAHRLARGSGPTVALFGGFTVFLAIQLLAG